MTDPRTVAIIQARMTSSRLPGKVMHDIGGEPMLARVVERVRRARTVHTVCVATTEHPVDDPVVALCAERGYPLWRGSEFDVLDRYYRAAQQFAADVIVRVTADCPVIDPDVIDQTVHAFFESGVDFAANRLPPPWKRTWPIGLDTEVVWFTALERAWREASEKYQREHVMPYFYDQEGRFKIMVLDTDPDYGSLRWTVDTPADLELIRRVYTHFDNRADFSWKDVLALFQREPDLAVINAGVRHKLGKEVDERVNFT
ncbi:MAG TPA: glycosyltransferase family protein [Levilinea sp.]|nr:glycosyltransferase family protein [Levilinea sp.]